MLEKNSGGKGVDDLGAVGPPEFFGGNHGAGSGSDEEEQTEFNPSRFPTCNSVPPYGCFAKNPFCRSMVIIKIDTSKPTFAYSPESGTDTLANTRMVCCSTSQTLQRCVDKNVPLKHNNGIHGKTVYVCSECLNWGGNRANFKKCPCGCVRYCSPECQMKHWPAHKALHNIKKKEIKKPRLKKKETAAKKVEGETSGTNQHNNTVVALTLGGHVLRSKEDIRRCFVDLYEHHSFPQRSKKIVACAGCNIREGEIDVNMWDYVNSVHATDGNAQQKKKWKK